MYVECDESLRCKSETMCMGSVVVAFAHVGRINVWAHFRPSSHGIRAFESFDSLFYHFGRKEVLGFLHQVFIRASAKSRWHHFILAHGSTRITSQTSSALSLVPIPIQAGGGLEVLIEHINCFQVPGVHFDFCDPVRGRGY